MLTKHEQLEERLREAATNLGEDLADLETTLTLYPLEDKLASEKIQIWLEFCDEVKNGEQRDATQLEVLQYPIQLLEENCLSKLNPRE
jgi:hypothetical protein